jgi:hypothetical protein
MSTCTPLLELAGVEASDGTGAGPKREAEGRLGGTGKPLLAKLHDMILFASLAAPMLQLKPTYM